jgi:hypothetical protein
MRVAFLGALTLAVAMSFTLPRTAECSSISANRVEPRELRVLVNTFRYDGQPDLSDVAPMDHAIQGRLEQVLRDSGFKLKEHTPQYLSADVYVRRLEGGSCLRFAVAADLSLVEHVKLDRDPSLSFGEEEDFADTWHERALAVADQNDLEQVETSELMKLTRSFLAAPGGAGRVPPRAAPPPSASASAPPVPLSTLIARQKALLAQGGIRIEIKEPVYDHLGALSRVSLVVDTSGSDAALAATLGPKVERALGKALEAHGLGVSYSEKVVFHVDLTIRRFGVGACEGYAIASELQLREPVRAEADQRNGAKGPVEASTWRKRSLALSNESELMSTLNYEFGLMLDDFFSNIGSAKH